MKVADLFISIGIDGATQVKNTLGDTSKGLSETTSAALFTKAAIVGVLYGLEQLVSTSNQAGAQLQQFAAFTGISAESLQRYAYAGRQFVASADEIKGSLQGVQKVMSQLETTGQGPAGLWVVSKEVGLDRTKLRDTAYVFEQLQKFAQQSKLPIGIANQALQSFGLSEGTIAAMRRNAFNPGALAKANIYTDQQTESLRAMNAQWGNLFDNWEKMIGRLNTAHGGKLISDLSDISEQVEDLIDALATAADKFTVFEKISAIFKELAVDTEVITNLFQALTGDKSSKEVADHFAQMEKEGRAPFIAKLLSGRTSAGDTESLNKWAAAQAFSGSPSLKGLETYGPAAPGDITVNQNFYGPTDPRAAGVAAKAGVERGVSDSVRQSHAQKRKN